jgi:hypothetical protein
MKSSGANVEACMISKSCFGLGRAKFVIRVFFIAAAILCYTSVVFAYSDDFQLSDEQKSQMCQDLDKQWHNLFEPELKKGASLVDVAQFALDAASVGYEMGRIETALSYLDRNINRSLDNPATYGNIFWYNGNTVINDANGVEFCMQRAVVLWILYQDQLSPQAKTTLQEILTLGSEGIKRHNVKLSYTNIILMKISNLLMLGEYFDKPELAETAYRLFKGWIVYSYQNGICEYLSPTYYTVDIENLSLIYHFTKNPEIKQVAETAFTYLWTDIAVNWYQPALRLGGTHSRDYDRLYGHGAIDAFVKHACWNGDAAAQKAFNSVFYNYAYVPPDADLRAYIGHDVPRFIYQRWGEKAYQRATNYIGHNFSVGSAEANYYNMDKTPFVVNLGSGTQVPVINFFMDGRSDYYGFKKIRETSGHIKSLHLNPFVSSVQNDGEVLFLAASKDNTDSTAAKLESVITLPADAEIWCNNRKLSLNARSSWQINPDANNDTTFLKTMAIGPKTVVQLVTGIGIQQKFAVSPYKRYSLKARLKGGAISLYINFYDKNNNLIEREYIKNIALNAQNFSWQEITETAPGDAVYCIAWVYSSSKNITETFMDNLVFAECDPGEQAKVLATFDFVPDIPQKIDILEDGVVFIKRQDAVTAIRPLKVLDINGRPIHFALYNDGLQYGALRLTATHSTVPTGKQGMAAIWSYSAEGIDDPQKFREFRQKVLAVKADSQIEQGLVSLKVNGITGPMELTCDINSKQVLQRRGMKPLTESSLLWVNGTDVGKRIFKGVVTSFGVSR